ncbi:hypothetical protein LZ32DRAFT_148431 [Colletotrichum eremochloae]|nr:hypothetical protein LZ32DRAFT_148431 [Colletotrichum eremochloae]
MSIEIPCREHRGTMCNELERKEREKNGMSKKTDSFKGRETLNALPIEILPFPASRISASSPISVRDPFAPYFDIVLFVLLVYSRYAHKSRKRSKKIPKRDNEPLRRPLPSSNAGVGITRRKA